jgi:hypothetical protein
LAIDEGIVTPPSVTSVKEASLYLKTIRTYSHKFESYFGAFVPMGWQDRYDLPETGDSEASG